MAAAVALEARCSTPGPSASGPGPSVHNLFSSGPSAPRGILRQNSTCMPSPKTNNYIYILRNIKTTTYIYAAYIHMKTHQSEQSYICTFIYGDCAYIVPACTYTAHVLSGFKTRWEAEIWPVIFFIGFLICHKCACFSLHVFWVCEMPLRDFDPLISRFKAL